VYDSVVLSSRFTSFTQMEICVQWYIYPIMCMLWISGDLDICIILGPVKNRSFEFRSQPRIARISVELEYQTTTPSVFFLYKATL
jgi:hypothetical protein